MEHWKTIVGLVVVTLIVILAMATSNVMTSIYSLKSMTLGMDMGEQYALSLEKSVRLQQKIDKLEGDIDGLLKENIAKDENNDKQGKVFTSLLNEVLPLTGIENNARLNEILKKYNLEFQITEEMKKNNKLNSKRRKK